jgi:hypothetical protein
VSLLSVLEDGEIYYVYRDGVEVEITKCSDFGLALRCSVILGKLCFINSTEKGSIKCTWGLAPRALNQQNHRGSLGGSCMSSGPVSISQFYSLATPPNA